MNSLISILPTILLLIQLFTFGIGVYLVFLAIKALKIYIAKNS